MATKGRVAAVAFNHDGTRIASGAGDQTVRIWDAQSGAEIARVAVGGSVPSVAWSRSLVVIASGSDVILFELIERGSGSTA